MNTTSTTSAGKARTLLAAGAIGGPLFVIVSLAQALTREGFDMRHHAFSLLSAGDLGWIQRVNFLINGILLTMAAVGMRRVMGGKGKASKWGPRLIGVFGIGTILAGIFSADPAFGFPPGTSTDNATISWHGGLHFLFATVAILGLIAACFVVARRFTGVWAILTRILAFLLPLALIGVSSGSGAKNSFVTPAFIVAASLGFVWVSAISAKFKKEARV